MDFVAAEAYLRKLLKLSPVHNAGTLQLARLLSEVHFSRANVTVTPELEATMDEICTLFEKSIAATKDVSSIFCRVYFLCFLTALTFEYPANVCARGVSQTGREVGDQQAKGKSTFFVHQCVLIVTRFSLNTAYVYCS